MGQNVEHVWLSCSVLDLIWLLCGRELGRLYFPRHPHTLRYFYRVLYEVRTLTLLYLLFTGASIELIVIVLRHLSPALHQIAEILLTIHTLLMAMASKKDMRREDLSTSFPFNYFSFVSGLISLQSFLTENPRQENQTTLLIQWPPPCQWLR